MKLYNNLNMNTIMKNPFFSNLPWASDYAIYIYDDR